MKNVASDQPPHWDLLGEPQLDALSELFHENSKIRPSTSRLIGNADFSDAEAAGFKSYHSNELLLLPAPATDLTMPLGESMRKRMSSSAQAGEPVAAQELGTLLFHAYGLRRRGDMRRLVPSAGGLFPLEMYAVIVKDGALAAGAYHYNVRRHGLERLCDSPEPVRLQDAVFIEDIVSSSGVTLIITAVFARTKVKYGERGYRFALMEAGHVAQNVLLAATARDLGACPIGGFIDDRVHAFLDIDGVDEAALYLVSVGSLATP